MQKRGHHSHSGEDREEDERRPRHQTRSLSPRCNGHHRTDSTFLRKPHTGPECLDQSGNHGPSDKD